MTDYFSLTPAQQRTIIEQTQNRLGLPPQAVEKDLWVTCILQVLFSLDISANIIFKGGTSLSKFGNLIERFSEDIDIAIDPSTYGLTGDLTKKQLKNLRKRSSLYVKEVLAVALREGLEKYGLMGKLTIEVEPDGEGDATYPEPRRVYITYQSLFSDTLDYLRNVVVLEIGSRSLMEPTVKMPIQTIIGTTFPNVNTSLVTPVITTAAPAKTFVEKICLLHELFSIERETIAANRRSRHLYDLERMMDHDFAKQAMSDNALWESIIHHRAVFTSMKDVDYSVDFRKNLVICPPAHVLPAWEEDYQQMCETMIFGEKLPFNKLLERIKELEDHFHTL